MKRELLSAGIELMRQFCEVNSLLVPAVSVHAKTEWRYGVCAYYRPTQIEICPETCAAIGKGGRAWSFPGYTVDRTPYGVIQHELGHHVDVALSTNFNKYRGDYSIGLRKLTGEAPISGYCPNDGEWFAEQFRLFVTNPDLLRILRPATYACLCERFDPVVTGSWQQVLETAPERTHAACLKKVDDMLRRSLPREHVMPSS